MNEVSIIINGVQYKAVDIAMEGGEYTCKDCDIYKERIPQNMMQVPLCMDEENESVKQN